MIYSVLLSYGIRLKIIYAEEKFKHMCNKIMIQEHLRSNSPHQIKLLPGHFLKKEDQTVMHRTFLGKQQTVCSVKISETFSRDLLQFSSLDQTVMHRPSMGSYWLQKRTSENIMIQKHLCYIYISSK
jgi:hypothetical protein